MKKTANLYLLTFLIAVPVFVSAQDSKKPTDPVEQEIRRLDLAEAEAIQKKDFQLLDRLAAADFTVNNPRNEIVVGKEGVKELIRKGVINYASFVREIEKVLIYENTAIVMGREIVVIKEGAAQAEQTVRRRYTNIWMKRDGRWLLTARHANIICP